MSHFHKCCSLDPILHNLRPYFTSKGVPSESDWNHTKMYRFYSWFCCILKDKVLIEYCVEHVVCVVHVLESNRCMSLPPSRRGFVFGLWSACASVGNILGAFLASSVLKYGYEVSADTHRYTYYRSALGLTYFFFIKSRWKTDMLCSIDNTWYGLVSKSLENVTTLLSREKWSYVVVSFSQPLAT